MRLTAVLLVLLMVPGCIGGLTRTENHTNTGGVMMRISSTAFKEGEMIPKKYTCLGEDINPQLKWEEVPPETKSFALIMDDPDAPMGTWTHWLVKDIPPNVKEIKEKSVTGVQIKNSGGRLEYHGPCPPSGVHRYFFKLYALDVTELKARNKEEFYNNVAKHKIGEASLMGKYTKESVI
jgi:Raf kinase inhibitor-like YbhB/YbcL family protein